MPPTPPSYTLPGSALEISRIALGTAPLATGFWGNTEEQAVATATAAIDAGIRLFDTAPLYGSGEAEERLGRALGLRRGAPRVLTTKVGNTVVGTGADRTVVRDLSADGVRRQLEGSLARLAVDRIDIVHVHDPEDSLDQAIDEAVPTLTTLRDEGVISAVSVGTNVVSTALAFVERCDIDLVMVAGRLTLLDRSARDELVPGLTSRGVPMLAAGVFNSGVLARPVAGSWFDYAPASPDVLARVGRLDAVCRDAGIPLRAAAMQYPLRFGPVAAVVVGMASPGEVAANLDDLAVTIPDDVWAALDAVE
jgi:D-threo-aldose 1-dehydrogenase